MTNLSVPVHIHQSEFPGQFRQELLDGLRAREIPGKWLYHSPAQAQLWLDYHQAFSPSRTDSDLSECYAQSFRKALEEMAVEFDGPSPQIVSLGCGGGQKDGTLFGMMAEQLGAAGLEKAHYLPLDTSPALVMEALLHVSGLFPALKHTPLVADLSSYPDLAHWMKTLGLPDAARLYTCFGMLPNFEPAAFPAYLRGLLREEDRLLVSANLSPAGYHKDKALILPQYDNPQAQAWYLGALESLGLKAECVTLSMETRPLDGKDVGSIEGSVEGAIWQIEALVRFEKSFRLALFGEVISFEKGETIRLFHSTRFTHQAAMETLGRAGLECLHDWRATSGEEGIFLCRATSGRR